jgi:hypothetical protein
MNMKVKWLALALTIGNLAGAPLACHAEQSCQLTIAADVRVESESLTLADLLDPGACPQLHDAAQQFSLGKAPNAGSVRVLEGAQIRGLLARLNHRRRTPAGRWQIPDRIVVRRAGITKSCAAIAAFLAETISVQNAATASENHPVNRSVPDLDCAAAHGVPAGAALELSKKAWNVSLQRWDFSLRCVKTRECVPFLVWARADGFDPALASVRPNKGTTRNAENVTRLVRAGQTATLTWDQSGIRVILPVTCLDAGGMGQVVRVRFKNAERILRAEVVGAGALRVSL